MENTEGTTCYKVFKVVDSKLYSAWTTAVGFYKVYSTDEVNHANDDLLSLGYGLFAFDKQEHAEDWVYYSLNTSFYEESIRLATYKCLGYDAVPIPAFLLTKKAFAFSVEKLREAIELYTFHNNDFETALSKAYANKLQWSYPDGAVCYKSIKLIKKLASIGLK